MRLQHVEITLSDGRVGVFTGREFVARNGPPVQITSVVFHDAMDVEAVQLPPADPAQEAKALPPQDPGVAFAAAVEEIRQERQKAPAPKATKGKRKRAKA